MGEFTYRYRAVKVLSGDGIVQYREPVPDFWDRHWRGIDPAFFARLRVDSQGFLGKVLRQAFRPGGRILEGGCGNGSLVYWLRLCRYDAVGIDTAAETISHLNRIMPDLPLHCADICDIPYPANTFDGYYSGGVFEHFKETPAQAINEAYRVLKPGGVLVSITPYLSLLRRAKARLGFYLPRAPEGVEFYQHLLSRATWLERYRASGFRVVDVYPVAAYAGLYHEITLVRMIDDAGWIPARIVRAVEMSSLRHIVGHSILCVLRKPAPTPSD